MGYTAAVITVSDKGARGERVDTSGPRLVSMLKEHGYDVRYTAIIPDEREQIKAELVKCADELRISLVLTTGGTGFSSRDITPEATCRCCLAAARATAASQLGTSTIITTGKRAPRWTSGCARRKKTRRPKGSACT